LVQPLANHGVFASKNTMRIRPPFAALSPAIRLQDGHVINRLGPIITCMLIFSCLWCPTMAQGIPDGYWRVLNGDAISLDQSTIVLVREQHESAAIKGRFAYTEFSFSTNEVGLAYTAGRIGDSTATSSQRYFSMPASYHALAPDRQVLRLETDGCPEFSYAFQDDRLILQRFTAQLNQLEFLPGTTDFANPGHVNAVIDDIQHHFECRQFERLLVTLRNQKSEFLAKDFAQLQQLELERIQVIKGIFAAGGIVARDQLQIHSSIAYDGTVASTVAFEFHKLDAWLQNDSLQHEIYPVTGDKYAAAGTDRPTGAFKVKVFLTTEQQAMLDTWTKEDWLYRLHGEGTDYATCLLLYAMTGSEIPAWYEIGEMEWKMYGKPTDLPRWEAYLEQRFPRKPLMRY
jgi:hypothetical protein